MNILFHLGHPAHFHLFKNVIKHVKERGHLSYIVIKKKDILLLIEYIRKTIPNVALRTSLIVGFPGETEEEFQETCSVFIENPFDFCHVFSFSEREGTVAARRDDQVPVEERQRRSAFLRRLSSKKRYDFYGAHLGTIKRVLFENPKPDFWPAYTDNYIRVVAPRDAMNGEALANRCAEVRLKRIAADFVEGEIIRMLD